MVSDSDLPPTERRLGTDTRSVGLPSPVTNIDDDRACVWLHVNERELVALQQRIVLESVREQAAQLSHEHFEARLRANAARPYVKHTRKRR